jgi:phage regulator Rha-like protein
MSVIYFAAVGGELLKTQMTDITLSSIGSTAVVDSRIIAEQLGIEHDSFMKNVKSYQVEIEQAFGVLRFEIEISNSVGQPPKFILLTEDQATFILSLSRNTPQVIKCKIGLVKAFSHQKAKLAELNTTIPVQKYLPTRAEIRQTVITTESQIFSTYCHGYGLPVCQVHNYITSAITGMTAKELREIDWVDGASHIGLNHIVSLEHLQLVSSAKLHFARIKRIKGVIETWEQRADRSIAKALKEVK